MSGFDISHHPVRSIDSTCFMYRMQVHHHSAMNHWYYARDNEIFLDLDSRRSVNRALHVLRLAMLDKSEPPKLPVESIYMYPTRTPGHAHIIVVLKQSMDFIERLAWSAWLGTDRLRLAYVAMRATSPESKNFEDLLVTSTLYYRESDDRCSCVGKHKSPLITEKCPVLRFLLGKYHSADYFYRTGPMPLKKLRIPWGKVSKRQLKEWTDGKGK